MIEVYKIVHGYYDPKYVPYLQPSCYHNTRGHNKKLFKLNSHLELRRHCFTVRVVSKWNSLPSDVVNAPSRLDKHWSSREFRYDYKAKFECWHHLQLEIQWSGYMDPVVFVQYLSMSMTFTVYPAPSREMPQRHRVALTSIQIDESSAAAEKCLMTETGCCHAVLIADC